MKVNILKFYLFFLFVNIFPNDLGNINISQLEQKLASLARKYSIDQKNNTQNPSLIHACTTGQYKALYHLITSSLDKINLHLNYWKTVQLSSLKYFMTNPIKALSGKQHIQSHIDGLEAEQKILATHLGLLKRDYDKDLTNTANLNLLIHTINTILSRYQSFDCSEKSLSKEKALKKLNKNFELMLAYEQQEKAIIDIHEKPKHMIRNWIGYTLSSIGLCIAGSYLFKNRSQIPTWKNQSIDATFRFWRRHFSDPIKNAWSIIFDQQLQDNDSPLTTLQTSVEQLITKYRKTNQSKLTSNELADEIEKAKNGFLPFSIINELNKTTTENSIASNVFNKSFPQIINIVIQIFIIHLLKKISNLELKHRLNIELSTIFPAALLFTSSAYILHKIYSICAPQKNIGRPLRFTLRNIENILNKSRHKEQLTMQEEGFIIYYVHHLQQYLPFLPMKDRPPFVDDITQLESSDFSIIQKISVIDRINRTYSFLFEFKT